MEERDMPKADLITAIVLIVFSAGVIYLSLQMPTFENRGANPLSAPGIVPGLLGGIIGFLGLVMLIRSMRSRGYRFELSKEKFISFFHKASTARFGLTILLTLIYAWGLVGTIDFTLATFLFVVCFILIFEYDRSKSFLGVNLGEVGFLNAVPPAAAEEAVLTAVIVSAVFRYIFLINLP